MNDIVLTVIVVAVVTVLLTLWARRRSGSTWSGVVERIDEKSRMHHQSDDDPGTTEHYMTVRFRTDAGKTTTMEFRRNAFDEQYGGNLAVGDRVTKAAGAWFPERSG